MRILLIIIFVTTSALAQSQQARCSDPQYRQFDFWIGKWRVENPDGTVAGTNEITRTYDGCVIEERWTGTSGMRGTSVNIWDKSRGVWHQTWVDSNGLLLQIEGGLRDGKMVMAGKRKTKDGEMMDRLTWSKLDQGRVQQLWETSTDGGKTWKVIFKGTYVGVRSSVANFLLGVEKASRGGS